MRTSRSRRPFVASAARSSGKAFRKDIKKNSFYLKPGEKRRLKQRRRLLRPNVETLFALCASDRKSALEGLLEGAQRADEQGRLDVKARLAIVQLNLGETSLAREMLRLQPDPTQRTMLIHTMSRWYGDVDLVRETAMTVEDPGFRSGICLGIGSLSPDELSADESGAWVQLFSDWYQQLPDSGTHSATAWALRQWNTELPAADEARRPAHARQWSVNSLNMTLIRVPAGSFVRRISSSEMPLPPDEREQSVTLTAPFWLSDREVAIWQFQRFMADPAYPASAKPRHWKGPTDVRSPTVNHPVQQVSWVDAVLFCNWMSDREQLRPWYVRSESGWQFNEDADGYRLPSEAEWEHACRARTTTQFACGNDDAFLPLFAVFRSYCTEVGGSRMPNGWGLFDMHGNVYEWCQDRYSDEVIRTGTPHDKEPATDGLYVLRSGAFEYESKFSRSSRRSKNVSSYRSYTIGFRVARNCQRPELEVSSDGVRTGLMSGPSRQ